MKNILRLSVLVSILALITIASCKKDLPNADGNPSSTGGYSSMSDFISRNGVPTQIFLIDAQAGGSFTTPQGTVVTVPANAFVTANNQPVSGNVIIEFKNIYKKSDMLLSNMPTMLPNGTPLKSGGEFYFNAIWHSQPLIMASGKQINVKQPVVGVPDPGMRAFSLQPATGWALNPSDTVSTDSASSGSSYVYTMNQLDSANYLVQSSTGGNWSNSDNASFFSAYTLASVAINTHLYTVPSTTVYLVFHTVNSVIYVHKNPNGTNFLDPNTPIGLPFTVVAMSLKNGTLYASFTPMTISSNMSLNTGLAPMTVDAFKTQLNALN